MLTIVIVTIGLLLILNGAATWIWTGEVRAVESPFPTRTIDVGGVAISLAGPRARSPSRSASSGCSGCSSASRRSASRCAPSAVNPVESRLVGVRVSWMLGLGWGLAAVLGAVSGMLAAPTVFLDPNMMQAILIYAFAAAVLGGIDSPLGAVVGGLLLGVGLNLLGQYVDFVGADLRLPAALLIILVVLLVRPTGLFGKPVVRRV